MTTQAPINEDKLNEFIGKFVADAGAVMHASTVLIGDKGMYQGEIGLSRPLAAL